jgi:hypothetical protein
VLPEIDLPDVHLPEKRARLAFLTREAALSGGFRPGSATASPPVSSPVPPAGSRPGE